MGDEGAKEVADLLKENQTIKSLHLSTNNISDEGVTHIAEALKSNTCVEEINLSMNKVRDPGCLALTDAVQSHKDSAVISLGLRGCTTINAGLAQKLEDHLKGVERGGVYVAKSIVPEEMPRGPVESSEDEEEDEDFECQHDGLTVPPATKDGSRAVDVPEGISTVVEQNGQIDDTVLTRTFSGGTSLHAYN